LREFTVGQHDFESRDVVHRHAICQGMWPAGILGNIAANRGGASTGWVGGEKQHVLCKRGREFGIHHAWLNHGAAVRDIDLQHFIHAGEGEDDTALCWYAASTEARCGSARNDRDPEFVGDPDDFDDMFGGLRKGNEIRGALRKSAIVLIEHQVFGTIKYCVAAKDFAQTFTDGGNRHGSRRRSLILASGEIRMSVDELPHSSQSTA